MERLLRGPFAGLAAQRGGGAQSSVKVLKQMFTIYGDRLPRTLAAALFGRGCKKKKKNLHTHTHTHPYIESSRSRWQEWLHGKVESFTCLEVLVKGVGNRNLLFYSFGSACTAGKYRTTGGWSALRGGAPWLTDRDRELASALTDLSKVRPNSAQGEDEVENGTRVVLSGMSDSVPFLPCLPYR